MSRGMLLKLDVLSKSKGHLYHDRVSKLNLPIERRSAYNAFSVYGGSISNVCINSTKPIDKITVRIDNTVMSFPGNGQKQMLFINPHKWIPCNVHIEVYPASPIYIMYDYVQHDPICKIFAVLPYNKLLYINDAAYVLYKIDNELKIEPKL